MRPVVDRHRDEGRPAGRLHRHVIGARDRRRHVLGARRLDAEFDIGPRKFRGALGIEKGLQRQDAARLLARGDHQRRLVAVRGVDVAERVADAGRRMQIDEAGVAGGLGVAIGHADHGGLLQAQHVVDIVGPVAQERQFGRAGIAEHLPDAERAQQIERRLLDGDGLAGGLCGLAGQCGVTLSRHSEARERACESEARNPYFPIVVMDSGPAPSGASRNDAARNDGERSPRRGALHGRLALPNSRSTAPCRRRSRWH